MSSIRLVENYSKSLMSHYDSSYIQNSVVESYMYIQSHLMSDNDVVLCVRETGHRLARYASVRVVVGHWSVTPHCAELEARVERFYRGAMTAQETEEFLKELGVKWIYWGTNELKLGAPPPKSIRGFEMRRVNPDVVLYAVKPIAGSAG
jgi:hypothetical protein